MKKNLVNDEIDLIEVFQIIWRKKNYVILSIVISLFLALLTHIYTVKFNNNNIKKLDTITTVSPIETIEESIYQTYSLALQLVSERLTQIYLNSNYVISTDNKIRLNKNYNLEINKITKNFLFKMFVEEISQRNNLENLIKKFNLIKEEDYPNKIEYKNAIDKIITNIRIVNLDSLNSGNEFYQITIEHQTDDINNWTNFLEFLEVEVNLAVRTKIIQMLNNYVTYLKTIKNFEIEDLKNLLLTTQNDDEKMILDERLSQLKSNKYIERINIIFNSSPISDKEKFYAGKINYESMYFKNTSSNRILLKKLYMLAILLGTILGIFFALIANAVQKRG